MGVMLLKKRAVFLVSTVCWVAVGSLALVGCSQPPDLNSSKAAASSGSPSADPKPSKTNPKCTPSPSGVEFTRTQSKDDDSFRNFPKGDSGGIWWKPIKTWKEMDRKERTDHMKRDVHPQMWLMFRRFSERFDNMAKFHCGTCHGQTDKPENPDFAKPSTLFPLDPKNMPTRNDCDPKTAAMVKFMEDQVTPAMRILVQNEQLDCFSCHARKGEANTAHP